jgi:hypothetical protein
MAGLHTAVFTDPVNCAFPPMTLFTAVDVQIGAFEYDGTEGLLWVCKQNYGGRAPTPVPDASRGGRLHVGRQQLIEWLVENSPSATTLGYYLLSESQKAVNWFYYLQLSESQKAVNWLYYLLNHQKAVDWFHANFLPLGVESTIYTVNQTLVTVQATYLLPAAAEAGGIGAAPAEAYPSAVFDEHKFSGDVRNLV